MKKFKNDLKLHLSLIATFGAGIGAFVPVVQKMMGNMNISTEITFDKAVLLTICSLTIIYLEEKKFKNSKEQEQLTSDSKSMLEELKMMGLGNGIVKLVIKSIESIKNLSELINECNINITLTVLNYLRCFCYFNYWCQMRVKK